MGEGGGAVLLKNVMHGVVSHPTGLYHIMQWPSESKGKGPILHPHAFLHDGWMDSPSSCLPPWRLDGFSSLMPSSIMAGWILQPHAFLHNGWMDSPATCLLSRRLDGFSSPMPSFTTAGWILHLHAFLHEGWMVPWAADTCKIEFDCAKFE